MKTAQQHKDEEKYKMGQTRGATFLTPQKVREIREIKRTLPEKSNVALASIFNCSEGTIRTALSDKYAENGELKADAEKNIQVQETSAVVEAIKALSDETTLENVYEAIKANNHLLFEVAEMLRRYLELPGYKASEGRGQSLAGKLSDEYVK